MIYFNTDKIELPNLNLSKINKWIRTIVKGENKETGQIRFIFCDDERILQVNQDFLDHDYYTDIITFDYGEKDLVSGEIYISIDTVLSNSMKYHTDYNQELHRVIIHGILHLCGQGDKDDQSQKEMTLKEDNALSILNEFTE